MSWVNTTQFPCVMYPSVKTIDYCYDFRHLLQRGCKVSSTTEQHGTVGPTCCCVGGYGSTRNRRICKYWEIEEMWMYLREFRSVRVLGDFVSSGCEGIGRFQNCGSIKRFWKYGSVIRDFGSKEYWETLESKNIRRFWKCGSIRRLLKYWEILEL